MSTLTMTKHAREEESPSAKDGNANSDTTNTTASIMTRNPKRARPSPTTTTATPVVGIASPAEVAAANINRHTLAGRRGDIRMHKAVAARLADPFLSPFEALKIGGFDYPSDEEPTSLDSDKVTLGQRKNQLSRRLRLAKKQMGETGAKISNGERPQASSKNRNNNNKKNPKEPSTPPLVTEGSPVEDSPHKHLHHPAQYHHDSQPQQQQQQPATRKASSSHTNTTTNTTSEASAIASLMASAQAMGLNLHQLACTVAANRNYLSNKAAFEATLNSPHHHHSNDGLPRTTPTIPKQAKVALKLHGIECKSLYDKSLVLAGADVDKDYSPNSRPHLSYCYHAWQAEGRRLRYIMDQQQYYPPPYVPPYHSDASPLWNNRKNKDQGTPGHPHLQHDKKLPYNGLHIHRLDGQCGHKPIIHNPKDGVPHIDFIVGDVVECYHGVDPINQPRRKQPPPSDRVLKWQSKYTCEEMDCPIDCNSRYMSDNHHMHTATMKNYNHARRYVANQQRDDSNCTPCTQPPLHNHYPQQNVAGVENTFAGYYHPNPHATHPSSSNHQEPPSAGVPPPAISAQVPEPKTIPIRTINENDPEWNFDPDTNMDDLLGGLLMHQQHHEL